MLDLFVVAGSLYRRGFWQPGDSGLTAQLRTFLGVSNEVGETAKVFRVALEKNELPDRQRQLDEAADTFIAATDYLLTAAGSVAEAEQAVRSKMKNDELRGFQHRGGPLRDVGELY
jgi:hypothetical protein